MIRFVKSANFVEVEFHLVIGLELKTEFETVLLL